jgi:hypothetical protein
MFGDNFARDREYMAVIFSGVGSHKSPKSP